MLYLCLVSSSRSPRKRRRRLTQMRRKLRRLLRTQEAACLETIADLNEELASTEKTLEETTIDLEKTSKEKQALEKYLLKIKPGCDFITENIDTRKDNRKAETDALNTAKDKLKGTPAYKSAAAAAEKVMLGKCADSCSDKSSVECKAETDALNT